MVDLRNFNYEKEEMFPSEITNHIIKKYNFIDQCFKTPFIEMYLDQYDFDGKHLFNQWFLCVEKKDQPLVLKLELHPIFNKFIPILKKMKFKNIDEVYLIYSNNLMFDFKKIKIKEPCVPEYMGPTVSFHVDEKYYIFLDKDYFEKLSTIQQELIFLHEMGHKLIKDNEMVIDDECEKELFCDKMAINSLAKLQDKNDMKKNISKNTIAIYNFLLTYGYCNNKAVKEKCKTKNLEQIFKENKEKVLSYNERLNQLEKFAIENGYGLQGKN